MDIRTDPERSYARALDVIRQCREIRAELERNMKAARLLIRMSRYSRVKTKTLRYRYLR